jgi:hypothetical protein
MVISEDLIKSFETQINKHHEIYRIPIKAEAWEDLADKVLNDNKSDFIPFNHSTGSDINFKIGEKTFNPNLKSGVISEGVLTFSSHRLSRFKTLEEKLEFLNNVEYDSYLFLSRISGTNWDKEYHIFYLNKDLIDFKKLNWVEYIGKKGKYKDEVSGWVGTSDDQKIKCKIIKTLSHQLWIEIDISLVHLVTKIKVK